MSVFRLVTSLRPAGDQPRAIEQLVAGFAKGRRYQTLLGVTGSGKTFTMAHVIEALGLPTLVISHNKTLAAQLYSEFREFFPENAVHYFVSYYDYYQPEAYLPAQDIYIEKDASINDDLDRLRLAATSALLSRKDVIIVASVSCIYGLGSPEDYEGMLVKVRKGELLERDELLARLVEIQYLRSDLELVRGTFRPHGDVVELFPSYEETALRIEFFGAEVERITEIHPLTGEKRRELEEVAIYPAKHFVIPDRKLSRAILSIEGELEQRLAELRARGKLVEAQRLEARTRYDLELLKEFGYCPGIENYSRHLSGRAPGEKPYTLIDYFPAEFLTIVDESHVTVPQIGGMYEGDHSRKSTLVEYGFRLPSALDNRPLRFDEWERAVRQVLFVSATPGPYELGKCGGEIVEQIIRPTGLVDPPVHVRPAVSQVQDVIEEIRRRAERKERVLVTTLTKRLAEDLSDHLVETGFRCMYLHSEIDTIRRVEILRDLRLGKFDVLVGVNLLREGLDLPEVSLVCILDADKEGFLRSATSIIQMMGRAARHIRAEVILYADEVTDSIRRAVEETNRRRSIQLRYNEEHGIQPESIRKAIRQSIAEEIAARKLVHEAIHESEAAYVTMEQIRELEEEMHAAAKELQFERAAQLRDRIFALKEAFSRDETQARQQAAARKHRRRR